MSSTFREHLGRLRSVFDRLRKAGLKLKPQKCSFLQRKVSFLGHVVSAAGIQTDPEKTAAVREWPTPTNVSELKGFLGLLTYYRRFIPSFSTKAEPLNCLTRKHVEFKWGPEQEKAFSELKHCLTQPPVLGYPNFGKTSGPFILDTDASSGHGIGAVLSQRQDDGTERVLAYGSRALHRHERNYCATRLEMLALVDFIDHFRYYLLGRQFLVRTDHRALKWLMSFKQPEGQVARWLERLQEYNFTVEPRPGKAHANADALSCQPRRKHGNCPSCGETEYVSTMFLQQNRAKTETPTLLESEFSWKANEIAQAQRSDPDIGSVIGRMEEGKGKPPSGEMYSPLARAIWAQYELLEVKGSVLRIRPKDKRKNFKSRVVLPGTLIKPALQRLHDGLEGGHLGQLKTLRKVQTRFWRPGLAKAVKDHCAACLTCAECKPPRKTPKAPLQPIPSSYPFQRLHIDIIGPLPRTKRGNRYILTVQCSFTKWVEAYALPNQRAKTCARALIDHWVYRFGAPDAIHSDQGRNFESHLFEELCQLLEIKKTRTTPYHPAGNGQVENANKTVKGLLMAKVEDEPELWDEHLGASMMAYRSSEHTSTGYTPFALVFGREIRFPLDVMMGVPETAADQYGEYVSQLKIRLSTAFQDVRKQLKVVQQRQKEYFDRGVKARFYQPGDQVFLFNPQLKLGEAAKFHRKWKGPYEVLERITEVNYRIKLPGDPASRSKVVHFDNLKLYQRVCVEQNEGQSNDNKGQGSLKNERNDLHEPSEEEASTSADDLDEAEDAYGEELPDFYLPIPDPVTTTHDPNIQGHETRKIHNHQHEAQLPTKKQSSKVDPAVQCIPRAIDDTAQTTQTVGSDIVFVPDGDVEQVKEVTSSCSTAGSDCVPPSVSTEVTSQADCNPNRHSNRTRRPPDRYGDWELNTITLSGCPSTAREKFGIFKAFIQEQKSRVLCLTSEYMRKTKRLEK